MSEVQFLTGELLLHDVPLFSSHVSCLRLLAVKEDAQHATKVIITDIEVNDLLESLKFVTPIINDFVGWLLVMSWQS